MILQMTTTTLRFFSSKCSLSRNSNVFDSCIIYILYTGCAKIKKKFRRQKVNDTTNDNNSFILNHQKPYRRKVQATEYFLLWASSCPLSRTFWFRIISHAFFFPHCLCNFVMKSYTWETLKAICRSRLSRRPGYLPVMRRTLFCMHSQGQQMGVCCEFLGGAHLSRYRLLSALWWLNLML